jgi:hypothetical protein
VYSIHNNPSIVAYLIHDNANIKGKTLKCHDNANLKGKTLKCHDNANLKGKTLKCHDNANLKGKTLKYGTMAETPGNVYSEFVDTSFHGLSKNSISVDT